MVDVGQVVVGCQGVRQEATGVEGGAALHRLLLVQQVLHVGDGLSLPEEFLVDGGPSSSSSCPQLGTL